MLATTRTKLTALLILFTLLSVASIITVYFTHQLPTEKTITTTLVTYEHRGRYDYTAKLKPNNLYNQTTLKPGEGTLYTRIIDHINITFSYTFLSTRPTNTTIEYLVNRELESPGKWAKNLEATTSNTVNFTGNTGGFTTTLYINITETYGLVSLIDKDTGTSSSTFNLNVKPQIHTVAQTEAGTINEPLTPTLTITFQSGTTQGTIITIENLDHTKTGEITQTETIYQQWVTNQRYASYAISLPALTGLAYITWAFIKTKPKKPEKPLEEIIAPYKEIIIDVAAEPSYKDQRATITMKSLEDLVNLADGLAKPVFHLKKPAKPPSKEPTHVLYVLDGLIKYEYAVTAHSVTKEED